MVVAARDRVVAVMSKVLWRSTYCSRRTHECQCFAFRVLNYIPDSVSKDAEMFRNSVYIKHRIRADPDSFSASDLNSLQDQEAKTPGPESNSENRPSRKGTQ